MKNKLYDSQYISKRMESLATNEPINAKLLSEAINFNDESLLNSNNSKALGKQKAILGRMHNVTLKDFAYISETIINPRAFDEIVDVAVPYMTNSTIDIDMRPLLNIDDKDYGDIIHKVFRPAWENNIDMNPALVKWNSYSQIRRTALVRGMVRGFDVSFYDDPKYTDGTAYLLYRAMIFMEKDEYTELKESYADIGFQEDAIHEIMKGITRPIRKQMHEKRYELLNYDAKDLHWLLQAMIVGKYEEFKSEIKTVRRESSSLYMPLKKVLNDREWNRILVEGWL